MFHLAARTDTLRRRTRRRILSRAPSLGLRLRSSQQRARGLLGFVGGQMRGCPFCQQATCKRAGGSPLTSQFVVSGRGSHVDCFVGSFPSQTLKPVEHLVSLVSRRFQISEAPSALLCWLWFAFKLSQRKDVYVSV